MQNPTSADMIEFNATVAASATTSSTIALDRGRSGSFQLGAFTGTSVEVKISNDGVTWTSVQEEGNETNPITVAANGTYPFPIKTFSAKFAQLTVDAQAAARTIKIFIRG